MPEVSIKIKIVSREYPLTIKPEEEDTVRKAAELINQQVNKYEKNYSVSNKQDLLAMSALQLATQVVKTQQPAASTEFTANLTNQLIELERNLSDYLNKA
jgi:cell division protein ZapA (FtsZ GTPase activity inhibitor)